MVFSSATFLFVFLPIVLAAYHAVRERWTNVVLIAASLAFYTWGAGWFVIVLVATTMVDHRLALAIHRRLLDSDIRGANRWVAVSVVQNLAVLGWFKYSGLATRALNEMLDVVHAGSLPVPEPALPLAISFFTFQGMSYVFDVRRGATAPVERYRQLLLCVCLFPHLIAGPLVRFSQLRDEIDVRDRSLDNIAAGIVRFSHGLAKKVLVADVVAKVADAAFGADPNVISGRTAVIGALAYTIQIYFDFSGYSDMAIGLARMLGFHFPENFDRPYSAMSVTDFWRRWHISLSGWFRDYLYIPLGGNRGGRAATMRNLALVFLVTGLWHGAALTFVMWGLYHGAWLLLERVTGWKPGRVITAIAVIVGWVVFRASSLEHAGRYLWATLAGWGRPALPHLDTALTNRAWSTLVFGLLVFALPAHWSTHRFLERPNRGAGAYRLAVLGLALPSAVVLIAAGSFSPFLYFRF